MNYLIGEVFGVNAMHWGKCYAIWGLLVLAALQSGYWCDAILFYCDGQLEFLLHALCQLLLLRLG